MAVKLSLRQNSYTLQLGLQDDQAAILWGSVTNHSDCWEWIGCRQGNGYGRIRLNGKTQYAHRVSYFAFKGIDIPPGMDICHKCDNRQCVNPDHLFVGSRKENMEDAVSKGRQARGAMLPHSKLAPADKAQIVHRAMQGDAYKAIASDFGITPQHVGKLALTKGIRRNGRH